MDWYISRQGVKEGPYTSDQIQSFLQAGSLAPAHLAWRFGLGGWMPIGKIRELPCPAPAPAPRARNPDTRTGDFPAGGARGAALKSGSRCYCARHWRGELSLPVSFWVNGNLLGLVLAGLVLSATSMDSVNESPRLFSAGGVAYWLLFAVMTLWQAVGIWRSAGHYIAAGKAKPWGRLAQIMAAAGMMVALFSLALVGVPQTMEFAKLAMGRDPIGAYQLRLLRNAELEISGAIVFGLTDDVAKILDANPQVRIIHLNSQGGRVGEARRLRDLIASRKLATFTATGCYSACTLAYAAGSRRLIGTNASLGFHQYAFPGVHPNAFRRQYEIDQNDWLKRGIDRAFIERAYATPHDDLWRPLHDQLFAAHFVTGYRYSREPARFGAQDERYAALDTELSTDLLFAALKEHDSGLYRRALAELEAGFKAGRSRAELSESLLPLAQSMYREKLPHASDAALLRFTDVFIEQTWALYAADPALCYQYVYAPRQSVDVNRYFSPQLKEKEISVMAEVIRSAAAGTPPAPTKEQVQRQFKSVFATLTERYGSDVALLTNPARGKSAPAKMCVLTRELYRTIRKLPESESAKVLRFMFANAR